MLNFNNVKNNQVSKEEKESSNGSKISKPKAASLEKYIDPNQEFNSKQLKQGIWLVSHKVLLYKILIISLLVASAILWLFSLWRWGVFLFGFEGAAQVEASLTRGVNYSNVNKQFTPVDLQINSSDLFSGGVNKYDAVSEMTNPNDRYIAFFEYYFILSDTTTPVAKAFLLPNETKLIASMGQTQSGYSTAPTVVVQNVVWQRVSAHNVSDTTSWQSYRLNFTMSGFKFNPASSAEGTTAAIQFKLKNSSPYGYVSPKFIVGLYQGQSLAGVMPLAFDTFKSGEEKDVELHNFVSGLSVSSVEIYPQINIYDDEVFLAPEK